MSKPSHPVTPFRCRPLDKPIRGQAKKPHLPQSQPQRQHFRVIHWAGGKFPRVKNKSKTAKLFLHLLFLVLLLLRCSIRCLVWPPFPIFLPQALSYRFGTRGCKIYEVIARPCQLLCLGILGTPWPIFSVADISNVIAETTSSRFSGPELSCDFCSF